LGILPLTISAAVPTGTGFTVSGVKFPVTLNTGQSVELNVQFDPTVTGAVTGQLMITSNSQTNGTAMIGLTGAGQSEGVELNWQAPSSPDDPIAGYNVYRSPSGISTFQLLNSSIEAQTAYADNAIQSGQAYDYIVKSVDDFGVESAPSNTFTITIP
jgi:hypothetical protein